MDYWAEAPELRGQMVLFATKLDEVLAVDHPVRMLDGGFAPNYTPLATVDVASGLIVAYDVIAMTNEEHDLVAQVEAVQRDFRLEQPVSEVLADTRSLNGANLKSLSDLGVCASPKLVAEIIGIHHGDTEARRGMDGGRYFLGRGSRSDGEVPRVSNSYKFL